MTKFSFIVEYGRYLKGEVSRKEVEEQLPLGYDLDSVELQDIIDSITEDIIGNKPW